MCLKLKPPACAPGPSYTPDQGSRLGIMPLCPAKAPKWRPGMNRARSHVARVPVRNPPTAARPRTSRTIGWRVGQQGNLRHLGYLGFAGAVFFCSFPRSWPELAPTARVPKWQGRQENDRRRVLGAHVTSELRWGLRGAFAPEWIGGSATVAPITK